MGVECSITGSLDQREKYMIGFIMMQLLELLSDEKKYGVTNSLFRNKREGR